MIKVALLALLALGQSAVASTPDASTTPHYQTCQSQSGANASVLIRSSTLLYIFGSPGGGRGTIEAVAPGDEIAVFTPEGICAGKLTWEGEAAVLALWEDDPQTNTKDGFSEGDLLTFHGWDASREAEFFSRYMAFESLFETSRSFEPDEVYLLRAVIFTFGTPGGRADDELARLVAELEGGRSAAGLPTDFALESNYPNPFASSTTFEYALPEAAHVKLDVYDVLGRRVATVIDGEQPAGRHEATLRADDLAAGVYFCRFRAGDFVADQRITVAR